MLNRIIEWIPEGIDVEGDQRHTEIIVEQLELDDGKPLSSPPDKLNPKYFTRADVKLLKPEKATVYQAIVARGNYLSIDRSDIRFAVKELVS